MPLCNCKMDSARKRGGVLIRSFCGNRIHFALFWRLFQVDFCTIIRTLVSCIVVLQVIAPEEIVDPDVDEHSVMTYLSQFPKAKLKPGAPLRPKQLFPNKVKAYGPGG